MQSVAGTRRRVSPTPHNLSRRKGPQKGRDEKLKRERGTRKAKPEKGWNQYTLFFLLFYNHIPLDHESQSTENRLTPLLRGLCKNRSGTGSSELMGVPVNLSLEAPCRSWWVTDSGPSGPSAPWEEREPNVLSSTQTATCTECPYSFIVIIIIIVIINNTLLLLLLLSTIVCG